MRVAPELPTTNVADGGTNNVKTSQQKVIQNGTANSGVQDVAELGTQQANENRGTAPGQESYTLSFRKDASGKAYYVILDSQTGQIVREVPPEEVRQVSEGIEDYLKSQAAQAPPKTDMTA